MDIEDDFGFFRIAVIDIHCEPASVDEATKEQLVCQRTANRDAEAPAVSLTSVWRGCEFQEREVFDLFGIRLEGHPDLRRILMWDGFKGFPMRRDYVAPDDFEYEPTPHDEVLGQARKHWPAPPPAPEKAA